MDFRNSRLKSTNALGVPFRFSVLDVVCQGILLKNVGADVTSTYINSVDSKK